MISAKVILDSLAPSGVRLTTMELTFPRFILAELNTHRMLSKSAASSRAIPVMTMIRRIWKDPAMPVWWGANQKGMQANVELSGWRRWAFQFLFMKVARTFMLGIAWLCAQIGGHKQLVNRLTETWSTITVIATGTNEAWANLFWLRLHPDAQPEFQATATEAFRAYLASTPTLLAYGDWHLPYIQDDERTLAIDVLKQVSAARCARVSYLTHEGKRDISVDQDLFRKLIEGSGAGAWRPGHWSPFEHVAQARDTKICSGNFIGWSQYRKEFPTEYMRTIDPRLMVVLAPQNITRVG